MAINGVLNFKDKNGDITTVYPVTSAENVAGLSAALAGKVDKEAGKGLSANDYTTTEKEKLAGIEAGANAYTLPAATSSTLGGVKQGANITIAADGTISTANYTLPKATTTSLGGIQVGTDLNIDSSTGSLSVNKTSSVTSGSGELVTSGGVYAALENKVDKVSGKGLSSNDYSDNEKNKLSGIEAGAEVNVQSDWNQTTSTADDYIKNKPTLGTAAAASASDFATAAQGTKADNAIPSSAKGTANGVAELDSNGLVPASQLPSFVDDVVEYASAAGFPVPGENGKIYVAIDTNLSYRWSGSAYVEISPSLALGTTESTAYRGDRGQTAYEHATDASRLTTAKTSGLYKIAATAEGHVASATPVTKSDITALGIPAQDTTYSEATTSTSGLMSASDKSKLNGIEAQANKTVISTSVPSTPTNNTVPSMKLVADTYATSSSLASGLATKADASTVTSLSSQVSTNATNIATQTARIDEIASLPSGSTSGDAELMDIRIKADGTTATSAGAAVRGQITDINNNISDVKNGDNVKFITVDNVLEGQRFVEGKYLAYDSGQAVNNPAYGFFDRFLCEPATEYYLSQTQCHVCFYNANKTYVSGFENATNNTKKFTTPANVYYMAVSCLLGHKDIIYCRKTGDISPNVGKRLSPDIKVHAENVLELDNTIDAEISDVIEKHLIGDTFVDGYYYAYNNGVKYSNADYSYSDLCPIKENTVYYINLFAHICFYNKDGNFISGWENTSDTSNHTFTTPANATYMRVSCLTGHKSQIYISEEWGTNITSVTSRTTDVLRKTVYLQKESLKYIGGNTIIVDKNGKGDYTTVTAACAAAKEHDTIKIMPGVYEDEEIWGTYQKTLYLEGVDKNACIIKNSQGKYAHPAINMSAGVLKNLTFYAEKTASSSNERTYAVHVESDHLANNALRIENCILKSDFGPGLGMGMRGGCHVELLNTDFICTKADDSLYFHDSNIDNYLGEQRITIRDCLMYSPYCWHTIYLQSQEKEDSMTYVEFLRNRIKCTGSEIMATENYYTHQPTTDPDDFKGLMNWRLTETSWGNSYEDINNDD